MPPSTTVLEEEVPQEIGTLKPIESYQPKGILTCLLLKKIREEGEDFWIGR